MINKALGLMMERLSKKGIKTRSKIKKRGDAARQASKSFGDKKHTSINKSVIIATAKALDIDVNSPQFARALIKFERENNLPSSGRLTMVKKKR